MIVCSCTGISDRTIRALASDTPCSLDDVVRACDAGGGCGGCRREIESILRASREPTPSTSRELELAPRR